MTIKTMITIILTTTTTTTHTHTQVIQLERKGFYRCDVAYGGADKQVVLFAIPDGKQIKSSAPVLVKAVGGKKK